MNKDYFVAKNVLNKKEEKYEKLMQYIGEKYRETGTIYYEINIAFRNADILDVREIKIWKKVRNTTGKIKNDGNSFYEGGISYLYNKETILTYEHSELSSDMELDMLLNDIFGDNIPRLYFFFDEKGNMAARIPVKFERNVRRQETRVYSLIYMEPEFEFDGKIYEEDWMHTRRLTETHIRDNCFSWSEDKSWG